MHWEEEENTGEEDLTQLTMVTTSKRWLDPSGTYGAVSSMNVDSLAELSGRKKLIFLKSSKNIWQLALEKQVTHKKGASVAKVKSEV